MKELPKTAKIIDKILSTTALAIVGVAAITQNFALPSWVYWICGVIVLIPLFLLVLSGLAWVADFYTARRYNKLIKRGENAAKRFESDIQGRRHN